MQKAKIIVIASAGLTTNLLVECLSGDLDVHSVFIEQAESKTEIIKRRIKRIGFLKTSGQVLFMSLALPFIPKRKKRISTILSNYNLKGKPVDKAIVSQIKSTHDASLIELIERENPSLIFINGTRILKKDLLEKITCPIVNIHVGITPKYRGVHGGYWAVRNEDLAHFGVTLHYVDAGIDTGKIIAQKVIQPTKADNFKTYPVLQYCAGLELISENIENLTSQHTRTIDALTNESRLYYHPTFFGYIFGKK